MTTPIASEPELPALPERDHSKPAEQQGLFRKFDVRRTDGSDATPLGKHYGCEYFVLDIRHDPHAKAALAAYADAVEATHEQLAAEMRERYALSSRLGSAAETADTWQKIVRENDSQIGQWFNSHDHKLFRFFGIVHGDDDYYYGMWSKKDGLRLLSCVGSIEGHGYTPVIFPSTSTPDGNTGTLKDDEAHNV